MMDIGAIRFLLDRGRFKEAEAAIRKLIAEDPDEGFWYALLSAALLNQDKPKAAEEAARKSIALDPDDEYGLFWLARILMEQSRWKDALQAIEAAIEISPEDADSWALKASILHGQGKVSPALEAAVEGLKHDAEHEDCRYWRTIILGMKGEHGEADRASLEMLSSDPESVDSHCARGWMLISQNRGAEAEQHFISALRIAPGNEDARSGLATALKLRSPFMGWVLRLLMRISTLRASQAIITVVVFIVLSRLLVSADNAALVLLGKGLRIIFFSFILLWISVTPLFDLALARTRQGRLALSDDEMRAVKWCLVPLLLGGLFFIGWLLGGAREGPHLAIAWVVVAAMIEEAFCGTRPSVRRGMACIAGTTAVAALAITITLYTVIAPRADRVLTSIKEQLGNDKPRKEAIKALPQFQDLKDVFELKRWTVSWPAMGLLLLACYRTEIRERFEARAAD